MTHVNFPYIVPEFIIEMLLLIKVGYKVVGKKEIIILFGQKKSVFSLEMKIVAAKYTFYFLTDDILWIALLIFSTLININSEYNDELCEFGLIPINAQLSLVWL